MLTLICGLYDTEASPRDDAISSWTGGIFRRRATELAAVEHLRVATAGQVSGPDSRKASGLILIYIQSDVRRKYSRFVTPPCDTSIFNRNINESE